MIEINVYNILKLNVAISANQAKRVVSNFNNDKNIILDFKEITDVTTAFFNEILDYFSKKNIDSHEIKKKLKLKNCNTTIKFAYGDAYELFKKNNIKIKEKK